MEGQKAIVTRPAPAFTAEAWNVSKIEKISLDQYKGKYVVLFWYPLDFTFVCPTEITQFSDKSDEFAKNNCQVIAASTDSHFSHREWASKERKKGGLGTMKIPMLADQSHQIARDYGCLVPQDDGSSAGISFRATYIIDDKGILRHSQIQDLPVGRNADEILRLVQAFQYTDEYGEVCPSGWKPGGKTMVPDADAAKTKDFFSG